QTIGHWSKCFLLNKSDELTPRIKRWVEGLMEYNFSVEYVPGPKNTVADFLSRASVDSGDDSDDDCVINWVREMGITEDEWKSAAEQDYDRVKLEEFVVRGWPEYKDISEEVLECEG
ncbi:hypothetical protein NDU88_005546, partial [Pleurodeles waltl]